MKIEEYQSQAKRTLPDLGDQEKNVLHMLLGLSTEIGELHDIYKRAIAYGKSIDLAHVKEEIGDIEWYIANLCNINNFDLGAILDTNISKLRARYPSKFTTEAALNRDLDKENKVIGKE